MNSISSNKRQYSELHEQVGHKEGNFSKLDLCSSCGSMLDAGEQFCGSCGKSVEAASCCQKCKAPLQEDATFCPDCGAPYLSNELQVDRPTQDQTALHNEVFDRAASEKALPPPIPQQPERVITKRPDPAAVKAEKAKKEAEDKAEEARILRNINNALPQMISVEEQKRRKEETDRKQAEDAEARRVSEEKSRLEEISRLEAEKAAHERDIRIQEDILKRKDELIRDQTGIIKNQNEAIKDHEGTIQQKEAEIAQLVKKNMQAINENKALKEKYTQIMAEKKRLEQLGKMAKWKCNLCGMLHNDPSECSKPELGGTWVYV